MPSSVSCDIFHLAFHTETQHTTIRNRDGNQVWKIPDFVLDDAYLTLYSPHSSRVNVGVRYKHEVSKLTILGKYSDRSKLLNHSWKPWIIVEKFMSSIIVSPAEYEHTTAHVRVSTCVHVVCNKKV